MCPRIIRTAIRCTDKRYAGRQYIIQVNILQIKIAGSTADKLNAYSKPGLIIKSAAADHCFCRIMVRHRIGCNTYRITGVVREPGTCSGSLVGCNSAVSRSPCSKTHPCTHLSCRTGGKCSKIPCNGLCSAVIAVTLHIRRIDDLDRIIKHIRERIGYLCSCTVTSSADGTLVGKTVCKYPAAVDLGQIFIDKLCHF